MSSCSSWYSVTYFINFGEFMSDLKKIAWIGGYPAHYMCELHTRLEEKFPGRIHFFYVEAGKKLRDQRTYERGMLPNACEIIRDDSYFRVFRLMKKISQMDPGLIITASHYPRPIWLSALYFMLKKKNICYWSDTNIQDIFFKPVWWQFAKKTIFGFYLKKMFRLLYMGRQNKNFYIWATNRLIFDKKSYFSLILTTMRTIQTQGMKICMRGITPLRWSAWDA